MKRLYILFGFLSLFVLLTGFVLGCLYQERQDMGKYWVVESRFVPPMKPSGLP